MHDLGDLALGLQAPRQGRVFFGGEDWSGMDPREAERRRRRVGRVFAPRGRAAWIENLDVEENVMLAQLFNEGSTWEAVRERAEDLARRFGLDGLPTSRPSATPAPDLMAAQWVRAFLPDPLRLLILELPEAAVPEGKAGLLNGEVKRVLDEGTAVIWIDGSAAELDGLEPDRHFGEVPEALMSRW